MVMICTDRRAVGPRGSGIGAVLPLTAVAATRRLVTKPLPSDGKLPLAVEGEFAADGLAACRRGHCRVNTGIDRTGLRKVLRRGSSHG